MPKHEVGLEIGEIHAVGRVDIKIHVRSDDEYLGSLQISRGTIDWVAGRSTKYGRYSVSWEKFADWMEDRAPKPIGTRGRRAPRKRPR
jgi:hypothetical protein